MSLSKSFFEILLMAGAVASAQQQPPAPPSAPPQPPAPVPRILQAYKSVTTERLKKPEDNDWLMIRRTYDGWGHSPLKQITTSNVNKLQPVWVMSTGMPSGHEAPPIVNNGVMFVATPGNQVIAVDAKAGTVLWRYTKALAQDAIVLHRTSRGVALYGDKVFFAAADAVLVALDVKTGKEVWTTTVEENKNGYYMSGAPLVADGKVMVGVSGARIGDPEALAAYNVDTGTSGVEDVYDPGAGRAWQRDVAEGRQPVEDRWRGHMGHGELRCRRQSGLLGNRQRRPVDGRPAARRQPVHIVNDCYRCHDRTDKGSPPVRTERVVGLGRGFAADSGRLHAQRPDDQGIDQRRTGWLPLVPRAHEWEDQFRRRQAVREAERLQESRSEDRPSRR
jgi:hypothetical protein